MRFLVVSDVHGNRFGLESVLQAAQGQFDSVLCLGDIVGYGAHPNECCDIFREIGAHCLLGNHDAATLGQLDDRWFSDVAKAAVSWTRRELTAQNREWLKTLQPSGDWPEYDFQAVHGSLRAPLDEYITGPETANPNLSLMRRTLCLYGHTHCGMCYRRAIGSIDNERLQAATLLQGGELDLEEGWLYMVNPGSCGQPRDGNPQARYAILDTAVRAIEIVGVHYDRHAARQAIVDAGLPDVLGDRLLVGR